MRTERDNPCKVTHEETNIVGGLLQNLYHYTEIFTYDFDLPYKTEIIRLKQQFPNVWGSQPPVTLLLWIPKSFRLVNYSYHYCIEMNPEKDLNEKDKHRLASLVVRVVMSYAS